MIQSSHGLVQDAALGLSVVAARVAADLGSIGLT